MKASAIQITALDEKTEFDAVPKPSELSTKAAF